MRFPHWNNDKGEFELVEVKRIYVPTRTAHKQKKQDPEQEVNGHEES